MYLCVKSWEYLFIYVVEIVLYFLRAAMFYNKDILHNKTIFVSGDLNSPINTFKVLPLVLSLRHRRRPGPDNIFQPL